MATPLNMREALLRRNHPKLPLHTPFLAPSTSLGMESTHPLCKHSPRERGVIRRISHTHADNDESEHVKGILKSLHVTGLSYASGYH